jgi:hypothetical protein
MARKKTNAFWLTASVTLSAATTYVQTTIPLGSYIDVAAKQAIAILEVDYISQSTTFSTNLAGDRIIDYQLTDINRGDLVVATDTSLISRGALAYDNSPPNFSNENALFPDTFGTLDEARMVVNDDIFFGAEATSVSGGDTICTVRIKAMVVSLSEKDFMALALTSVASA